MHRGWGLLGSFTLGAAAMYLLDPQRGRRRQALIQEQMASLGGHASDALDVASRDLANRTRGASAEVVSLFSGKPVTDQVLAARVRAKIGRVVSHPHALRVEAWQGCVTLSGPLLKSEEKHLMRALWSVRGVTAIANHLEVHRRADISALQGGRERPGERTELLQRNWPPAWRLLAGMAGASLSGYGFARRNAAGGVLGVVGLGLAARALVNRPVRQLLGERGQRGMHLRNSITIHAPVDRVFAFWRHPENFPSFMRNVREVRPIGDDRYHWTVAGPAGTTMEWDAVTTRCVPNRVISWTTLPGAAVEQSGSVYFEPAGDGTRLHITMRYNPPAGAMGEAAAALFNADARREMDEDLLRMKSFLETGRHPHDAVRAMAQPAGQGKQAAFAGQTTGREMATAMGAGASPVTGTGTQAGGLPGRGDSGSGAIDRAEQKATMAEDQGLAHALAAGRQAVNEASAFQGNALVPEQRIRIARDAIDLLDAYRGRDEEVEGLITVLEGTIEGNQRLLDDARRPGA